MTWWRDVPDDTLHTLTGAQLKAIAAQASMGRDGPEWVSTTEAAAIVGKSRRYWADHAEAVGGFREDGGEWVLPLARCRDHLARKAEAFRTGDGSEQEPFQRGPYRQGQAA